jgi:hypothetical protein
MPARTARLLRAEEARARPVHVMDVYERRQPEVAQSDSR